MAALTAFADPVDLVPGDADGLRALSEELRGFATGAGEAAGNLRAIEAGSWVGPAAEAFRPGPLADPSVPYVGTQADTFRNGSYTGEVIDEPLVVHRYHDGGVKAREDGSYWTPGLPQGADQARFGNAIKPEWNDLTDVTVKTAPPGTTVYSGPAAPQTLGPDLPNAPGRQVPDYQGPGVLGGGDAQIFLPKLPDSWGYPPRG